MRGTEAYLKPSEPSEQQPDSEFTPWFAAAAGATARMALFGVGAALGAASPGQSVGDALDGHTRNSPQMAHSSARTPPQFETGKKGPKEKSVTAITSDAVSRKVLSSCRLV